MDERMLATVAVRLFNERALTISFKCAICGAVFDAKLSREDTEPPVLDCPNDCFNRNYTLDASGEPKLRELAV